MMFIQKKSLLNTGLTWLWLTILIILLDRVSKNWVLDHLTLYVPLEVLPIFNLTLAYNTGAAFSFLHSMSGWQNWFLAGLALVVSAIVFYWLAKFKRRDYWMNIALALILGGALGNAWDRVQFGYVIDFLSFHLGEWHFAIFNIADSAIFVGALMLILHWIRK